MVRTQIQLTERQAKALKILAVKEHVSLATLVRRGVDVVLESSGEITDSERRKRAILAAGKFRSGRSDLSAEHDKHIAEAFGS